MTNTPWEKISKYFPGLMLHEKKTTKTSHDKILMRKNTRKSLISNSFNSKINLMTQQIQSDIINDQLPDGWVETIAEKYCLKVADGTHDSPKQSLEGRFLVTSKNLTNGQLDLSSSYKISIEDFELVNKRSKVDKRDVLLGMIGTVGEVCLIDKTPDFAIKNVGLFKCGNETKAKFLYYYLKSSLGQNYILSRLNGTTQKYITLGELRNFPILHPLSEEGQVAIASLLSSFDRKIELLREENKTLEQTAQTIFQEWFGKYGVDDDKVNAEGREGALGGLPEGWRVGKLSDVVEFINGYAFKSGDLLSEEVKGCFRIFKMGNIKKGGGFAPEKTKSYIKKNNCKNLEKYFLKKGDLLMSMTDMKDAISLLGHTALMNIDDEYIVNQRVGLLRVNNNYNISYPYLYLITNNKDFIADLRGRSNSGVQVNLSTDAIKNSNIIIADNDTNKNFDIIVKPIFEKIEINEKQIQSLSNTRDELLPRLMKGEVRVKF